VTAAGRRPVEAPVARPEPQRIGSGLSFRARLTLGLIAGSVLPLAGFGLVLLATEITRTGEADSTLIRVVLFVLAAAVIVAVLFAVRLANSLTSPLRAVSKAVERTSSGDLSARVFVAGDDELARLVESHNRLANDLERRNAELGRILLAIGETSPRDGLDRLVAQATRSARAAFGMIDTRIELGDPAMVPVEEDIPGESRPIRAVLALPDERLGVLVGHLPATRTWDPADQDLLELYASEVAVAIRNLELYEQVQRQAEQLMELDQAKDEFLRGISHNLQTPLTSIRGYAEQMGTEREDQRLSIIVEQTDRLYRIVRQLVSVSRLESGTLKSATEVLALAPRVRRAWDALGAAAVLFDLADDAEGWLAIADPDQLDQVLWALLDNSARYAGGAAIHARVAPRPEERRLAVTIADDGPGVKPEDRDRIFDRYERGAAGAGVEGTGLGLYVSRSLCRAMGGDLILEPAGTLGTGAAFSVLLPGEPPEQG
jgi:signal transduction histidine kinase/HAMP domain-containing protein